MFKREDYEADLASAHACYDHIKEMFAAEPSTQKSQPDRAQFCASADDEAPLARGPDVPHDVAGSL